MISKEHRFHGHGALNYTYRNGRVVRGEMMSLRYVAARDEHYRLSVVVSKKVQKSAVIRNRIRRRVYEVVRNIDKTKGLPAYDMIISIFDERIATVTPEKLEKILEDLIEKSCQNKPKNNKNPRSYTGG